MEQLDWVKSSYSGDDCVEAARSAVVAVRDTKDRSSVITVPPAAWQAFLGAVRTGDEPA
ncbi:DUF397 domain-containing protein [Streptomyces sp. 8K308]|uniref:DUF397 domain-containing protein n=1 Tax=Streptomyces sp. 8K308 TaxID=2530388 RepID=UPI00104887B7|nr:DUF397 domain-containing protein [Streptomyces sp. 8K308]TDC26652.1 DUF397 domain-containing protein [Streptomyces sp. 8K308]